jgi:protein tyrosine/serine phosphatase
MKKYSKTMLLNKRQRIIAAFLLCLAGSFGLWEGYLKDAFIPKRFGVVEPGQIYRSGQLSRWLIERTLLKHNIKVIVSLTGDSNETADKDEEQEVVAKLGIEKHCFLLSGNGTGDINDYAKAIEAICQAKEEGKPVLVHCGAGTQRAGGVIATYRLLIEKKDVQFVLNEMMNYDWSPEKNPNLLLYLNNNMEKLASLLNRMGVMDKIPNPLPQLVINNHKSY